MLPNSNDFPTQRPQAFRCILVPQHVRLYLLTPEFCIGLGPRSMQWTAMPEAAIDEDSESPSGQNDINGSARSWQQSHMFEISIALLIQERTNITFKGIVASASRLHPPTGSLRGWIYSRHSTHYDICLLNVLLHQ